jgi:5'-nucleotidase
MKILLTNDDGWDAPGLSLLQELAGKFGEIWTVAPAVPMSGISHQMTFERPLALVEIGPQSFSLDGTPVDCVRIAMTQLGVDFDWVLSGINNGGNLGSDIYVSGTVAAARESALRGTRSMALSQHRQKFDAEFDWRMTGVMAEPVLAGFLNRPVLNPAAQMINVNFPDRFHGVQTRSMNVSNKAHENPGMADRQNEDPGDAVCQDEVAWIQCELDCHPLPADFQTDSAGHYIYCGKYNRRPQMPGRDVETCFGGKIAVSFLKLQA